MELKYMLEMLRGGSASLWAQIEAADEIERLQKERDLVREGNEAFQGEHDRDRERIKDAHAQIITLTQERDAALAEVERLKAALKTVAGVDQRQRAARMEGE